MRTNNSKKKNRKLLSSAILLLKVKNDVIKSEQSTILCNNYAIIHKHPKLIIQEKKLSKYSTKSQNL